MVFTLFPSLLAQLFLRGREDEERMEAYGFYHRLNGVLEHVARVGAITFDVVLLFQILDERAREHPVQLIEQGVQCYLKVEHVGRSQLTGRIGVPGGQTTENFKYFCQMRSYQARNDG
uniref:Uncharacterized protein n=1 Tax=Cacopsylla melanoneura TaxID=428564 RepID=A0A8D9F0E1_9HEMI